ncbi:MAG TPA: serine hydrolase [Candidatus Saccharibacteria bacterium]|nr:serine hydrolase [Candidatus Saccharibacteria bacterium]
MCIVSFYAGSQYSRNQQLDASKNHPLLAKRIFIENANDTLINFEPLRAELQKDLEFYDERVSLYFEYLPTGTSIRIGDKYQSVAASLLKVPAVMELYKLAEKGEVNLDKTVSLKEEWLDDQYGTLHRKGAGHKLTIKQLAKITLEQSDNTALNGVQAIVTQHNLKPSENAFNALDVEFNDTPTTELELNTRSYSSFLKCLYFACYVSADSSQEIMTYLTRSTEGKTGRLGKYIPDDIKIAHKIGVAGENNQAACGIVYLSSRHYVLCVMINETQERGSEIIAQTSKLVYDYVKAAKPQPMNR